MNRRRCLLVLAAVLSLPLTVSDPFKAEAQITGVYLVPGITGQAFPRSVNQLVLDIPVTNRGTVAGSNVVVTSAMADSQTPVSPSLPITLGSVVPRDAGDLQLAFDRTAFPTGFATTLTVKGIYNENGSTRGFQLSIPFTVLDAGTPDGTTESQTATRTPDPPGPNRDAQGFYPHNPASDLEPNENEAPPVPIGVTRATPNVPASDINVNFDAGWGGFNPMAISEPRPQTRAQPRAMNDPLRFSFDRDFNGDIPPPPGAADAFGAKCSAVLDPTVARNNGDILLASGNWYLGVSLNAGAAFTALDPTLIFPAYPGGRNLAGDQIVHYAPTIDRFVYVAISRPLEAANTINELRIAVASPASLQADRTLCRRAIRPGKTAALIRSIATF